MTSSFSVTKCAVALRVCMVIGFFVGFPGCSYLGKRTAYDVVQADLGMNDAVAGPLNAKAAMLIEEENFEGAEAVLHKALAANRRNPAVHNNMGILLFRQNDLFKAAMAFQEAMNLAPNRPAPHNNLGLVFEAAGRFDNAIEHFRNAHSLQPNNPEYFGNYLRARLRMGEPSESLRTELQHLLFIETRPGWIDWIEDELELFANPNLDRGPETPELNEFNREQDEENDRRDRVIFDAGLDGEIDAGSYPDSSVPESSPRPMRAPLLTPDGSGPIRTQPAPYIPPAPTESSQPSGSAPINAGDPESMWQQPIQSRR